MSVSTAPSLEVMRHCRTVTRRRARNFYYGLKLLPEPQRSALYAMYAWMRRADDLVDNRNLSPQRKQDEVAAFREATDRAVNGDPPDDDPMWAGVAYVAQRFDVRHEHFHAMLDGQLADVRPHRFETFDDLRDYCYKVASTVGLVCIEIWGYSDPAARELAVDRGIAFQLTNILRDFREDYEAGRLYIPLQDLRDHELDEIDLRRWAKPHACAALIRSSAQRAASYYSRSAKLDAMITPSCRPTLWAMTTIYRNLLRKIEADPARLVSSSRVRLSAVQKAMIAVQARWLLPSSGASSEATAQ